MRDKPCAAGQDTQWQAQDIAQEHDYTRSTTVRTCMHVLSTIISSCAMSGYCLLISRTHSMNRPSAFFMMLALCTAVTRLRLLSRAYWNAYCATRVDAVRVMTCRSFAQLDCAQNPKLPLLLLPRVRWC